MVELNNIFDAFSQNNLFENKLVLQDGYIPESINHRDKEISQIAGILAPALRGERPSNLFIYGLTGTGKTISVQFVRDELLKRARNTDVKLRIEYLNCKLKKVADTEYRILAELIKKLGGEVPSTGLPTDQVYNRFIELVEKEKQLIILVLDEIDQAVKKISSDFLYSLTRISSELSKSQVGIVGISNDLKFLEMLDSRVRSSLREEEVTFPTYNAPQLTEILGKRAERAFKKNMLEEGVIQKCAAYAAREHGDARRALDLLRISGELAEREGKDRVTIGHVDMANEKIDKDKMIEIIKSAPKQLQIVLYAIILLSERKTNKLLQDYRNPMFTGDIYHLYQQLCQKSRTEILTQRRIGDLISEADMSGLINAHVISKGRHGRTREITLSIPQQVLQKSKQILQENLQV